VAHSPIKLYAARQPGANTAVHPGAAAQPAPLRLTTLEDGVTKTELGT